MRRALDLARRADGHVFPNPYVGAVVVHRGRIVGEGWHSQAGRAHAERLALAGVPDEVAAESTLYVTLEPCNHHGKTPPCAPYLVERRVGRVVVAVEDPHRIVAGRGITCLREGGIPVRVGVLEAEARRLNRRFFTYHTLGRPYVVLKWAQTLDGIIGRPGERMRISNETVDILVHRWRSHEHAILVTDHTIRNDAARLTVRHWPGFQPVRVVLQTQPDRPLPQAFRDEAAPTLFFDATETNRPASGVNPTQAKTATVHCLLDFLYRQNIISVMVEGGASLLRSWIASGMWDEVRLIVSDHTAGGGVRAPAFDGILIAQHSIDGNRIFIFKHPKNAYL